MRLAIAIAALAGPAFADAELAARYTAASEAMRAPLSAMFAGCAPGAPEMPERLGDEATDAAQACVIETAIERHGRPFAEALVTEAEAFAALPMSTLADMANNAGEVTTDDRTLAIVQECGLVGASQDAPGARYMMANMQAIMACMQ